MDVGTGRFGGKHSFDGLLLDVYAVLGRMIMVRLATLEGRILWGMNVD